LAWSIQTVKIFRRRLNAIRQLRISLYQDWHAGLARLVNHRIWTRGMIGIEIRSDAQVVRGQLIHATGVIIRETAIVEDVAAVDHRITLAAARQQ
jgi:serine acetyltransferase